MAATPSGSYPQPPVRPPAWATFTPSIISSTTAATIKTSTALLDSLAAVPKDQRTFESVVRPYALRMGEADKELEPLLFMSYVSTDKEVRDAALEADKQVNEWSLDATTRVDVYEALLDAEQHTQENKVQLSAEQKRLMDRLILERKRNGLGLSEEKRKEYLDIKKAIVNKETDFQQVCNEENGFLLFTREELDGVPEDVIAGFPEVDGKRIKMTHKTPDYVPVINYAHSPETRKRAVLSYEGKTIQNAPLLKEIVELRHKAVRLLGYESHAAWTLEVKMAKTPLEVDAFLADLEDKLRPLGLEERKKLLALKKEEHEKRGWEVDDEFYLWDYRYYDRLYTERHLTLDQNVVKEYFPVTHVVPAVLQIYKELLGVELVKVPRTEEAGGITWHEEADMFAVWESGRAGQGEDAFLGYMHLDLFPRENKYGHAAVWGLIPGWTGEKGERKYPVVSMVANLAKPTPGKSATLKHDDLVTLLHEMGHAYHGLLSKTEFSKFHGTAVSRDFVEAPSQMLENWGWTREQLKSLSSHEKTGEQLPDDLIEKLIASRKINQGLFNLRQLFFGKYDMLLHTTKHDLSADEMSKLWCDLREKTSLVTIGKDVVGGQSGFAHIAGGYSAGYYGYLYSQVFSADMFATVFEKDPMNPDAGRRYREKILQVGGSRDEMDSLVDFLGRKPNNEAFLKSLLG
ncbi:hypothetical protein JCM11641_005633 [Rhodosporidiobolus odoratus]